jgi:hypothetical protein
MRRASLSRALAALTLAVMMAGSSAARAGDTSTAEHLFQEGQNAMTRKDYAAACDAFNGSNEADPSPGTQINLALCSEKLGKVATAWGWYRTAAGLADQRGQKDRAELARAEAAKLEPKLHMLVIRLTSPVDGIRVVRDGVAVPSAVVGKEVPVDPGEHSLEVSAKGKKPWKTTVRIAATPGTTPVDAPALEDAPDATPPPGATVGADYRPPAEPGRDGSTQRTIGFVLGGAGILALVTAGGIQIFNLAVTNPDYKSTQKESVAEGCGTNGDNGASAADPKCSGPTGFANSLKTKDDARSSNQTAALGVGIGGVALLAGGLILLFTAPSSSRSGSIQRPLFSPIVGRGQLGAGFSGSF